MATNTSDYFKGLEARLSKAVAEKLGVDAHVARWDDDPKTGAKIPVFAVPPSHTKAARALGLTVAA